MLVFTYDFKSGYVILFPVKLLETTLIAKSHRYKIVHLFLW